VVAALQIMSIYRILADLLVTLHLAFVMFIVLGMAAILLGIVFKWQWVHNFWFRAIHLLLIAAVVIEGFLGFTCPLTDWEDQLRAKAGETVAQGTFIGRMIHEILFVDISTSVLSILYCIFGLGVLMAFILAPPRRPGCKSIQK
jgi:hypothetical protein